MLANLITTILLALGVATNNGSNAFKQVEKITKPKQYETSISEDTYFTTTTVSYIMTDYIYINNLGHQLKYGLGNNGEENIISTNTYNIRTSAYNVSIYGNNADHRYRLMVTALQINTYYNFQRQDIFLDHNIGANGNQTRILREYTYKVSNDINELFDLTMTNNTNNEIFSKTSQLLINGEQLKYETVNLPSGNLDNNYIQSITLQNLEANNTYNILMCEEVEYTTTQNDPNVAGITPHTLTIQGSLKMVPQPNIEIVDIPNIMYTVLTMPFSFISTAFNLTVFPNTPYALNFGNLFLTILAVFILMWLLRKVFK